MSAPLHDHDAGRDHDHGGHGGHGHGAAVDDHPDGCGAESAPVVIRLARGERAAAVARARRLNQISLTWNVAEMIVALLAGFAAGSVSLIGFGIDSGIEVSAAVILAWRLHQERRGGCMAAYDRTATRLIAVAFVALAAYVWVDGVTDLVGRARPEASVPGLVLAVASVLLMPWLARQKRALAPALGSQAVSADAQQTSLCALLSAVLIVGVGLNTLVGWWWADPVAALVIGALALEAGRRVWRADSLADTCCG
ncbi:MAG: cation transporter [Actinomycetota bacterium]|jgi:divalent metal cation (Fe/Co/Zn/Cd) transporter